MVKIGSFYPDGEGKTFDMQYYCEKFVPLLQELFGDALKDMRVDQGVYGGYPDEGPFFLALGQFYFDTEEEAIAAYFPNMKRIEAERPKFTNIDPIVQISEAII